MQPLSQRLRASRFGLCREQGSRWSACWQYWGNGWNRPQRRDTRQILGETKVIYVPRRSARKLRSGLRQHRADVEYASIRFVAELDRVE